MQPFSMSEMMEKGVFSSKSSSSNLSMEYLEKNVFRSWNYVSYGMYL